jgi:hypothetical protein
MSAMQFGNTADDRQSQAAARLATVVQAVKTAEDGFSFFRGMPGPLSLTEKSTWPLDLLTRTRTSPPSGV